MRNNDNIIFIDHKGVSHNARVQSFREHRDGKNELVHHEPLVTLNYNDGPGGEPITLIDVPHIDHPSRKETNPELPSYPLHAWKREDEEHLEIPADHPVHDHFNEQPKRDEHGNIVPKRRPVYEMHQRMHKVGQNAEQVFVTGSSLPVGTGPKPPAGSAGDAAMAAMISVGHPAHPETLKFPFACDSCGASVIRTASHHGGKQWEQYMGVPGIVCADGAPLPGTWQEHVCKQSDIDAFRKKLEDAKKPPVVEPSASERLAAGEQLAPEIKKPDVEADVIAELEKAPPAPNEPENKSPEDAA